MAVLLYTVIAVCAVCACAAPPPRYYNPQLQQLNPLEYYLSSNSGEAGNYYSQQQKQGSTNSDTSSRLETLDPDSEVELLPGAQLPQQPPQQMPVAPNIPGLLPGQRVFIVHMQVLGNRPGTIGGYQPVYIVGAAPQGNTAYPGYQNPILVDPSGQVSPVLYQRPAIQAGPNALGPQLGPFQFAYQNPYQPVQSGHPAGLNQFVLQSQPQTAQTAEQKPNEQPNSEQKSSQQVNTEAKGEATTRNARPLPN